MKKKLLSRIKGQPEDFSGHRRQATFLPESYNPETRTIDVVMSTGSRGVRYAWSGEYDEELCMDPGAVRLDRMNNHAPFLALHNSHSADNVLGKIVPGSARIENGQLLGTVQFAADNELDDYGKRTVLKIISGIMRHLSIGYEVHNWNHTPAKDRKDGVKRDLYEAVDWEGYELSVVPMGFDDEAMTRGYGSDLTKPPLTHKERAMDEDEDTDTDKTTAPATGAPSERSLETATLDETAIRAEEQKKAAELAKANENRAVEIMERGEQLGIDSNTIRTFIKEGKPTVDVFRSMMDLHAQRKEEETKVNGSFNLERTNITRDERDTRARGIVAALASRMTNLPARRVSEQLTQALDNMESRDAKRLTQAVDFKPEHMDIAGDYSNRTLTEMGSLLLRDLGIDHGGSRDREIIARDMINLAGRANTGVTVSDFPLLFQDAMHVALIVLGEEEPLTFEPIARIASASDFRTRYAVKFGGGGRWKKTESGKGYDFEQGLAEEGENYKIFTWSVGFLLGRDMLVSDDIGMVEAILQDHAVGAKIMQNDLVWTDTILSSKTMSDGKTLLHADHGNVSGAAAAPSLETLNAMYSAFGAQKGPGKKAADRRYLNLTPMIMAMPATGDYYLKAHQLLYGQLVATKVEDTVPKSYVNNLMAPIREARIPESKWFGFANPRRAPVVEVAFLNGQRTPNVEQLESSRMEGIKYGAWMDLGASLVDWRGIYANQAAS